MANLAGDGGRVGDIARSGWWVLLGAILAMNMHCHALGGPQCRGPTYRSLCLRIPG